MSSGGGDALDSVRGRFGLRGPMEGLRPSESVRLPAGCVESTVPGGLGSVSGMLEEVPGDRPPGDEPGIWEGGVSLESSLRELEDPAWFIDEEPEGPASELF